MMITDELLSITIMGHQYRGIFSYPAEQDPKRAVLLCPPNPFLGGQIDNPVVQSLKDALIQMGFATLICEYRALAPDLPSKEFDLMRQRFWDHETIPDQMPYDLADAKVFIELLGHEEFGGFSLSQLALAGYSYGGALAMLVARENSLPVFAISPPVRTLPSDYQLHANISLLYANEDLAVEINELDTLEKKSPVGFHHKTCLDGDDHFFLSGLSQVQNEVRNWANHLESLH